MDIRQGDSVVFTDENGNEAVFYVQEQTRVNGTDYLLVSEAPDGETDAYIFKDTSADGDETANYVLVLDEQELEAIADVFRRMMEDAEIVL